MARTRGPLEVIRRGYTRADGISFRHPPASRWHHVISKLIDFTNLLRWPWRTAAAKDGKYFYARRRGHRVVPIIMESFGGLAPDAVRLLDELARAHGARLGADEISAPWCARSFRRIYAMRITIALHCAAADEIMNTVQLDTASAAGTA